MPDSSDDIHIRIEGRAGRVTFTRPKALNALTHEMCLALDDALKAWDEDDSVALVLIDAEGEKAFCAGGDIAAMYHAGKAGDLGAPRRFWREEYRMNARIAEYAKPIVCLMQGFVMGGGVGVSGHASHRVVCDSTRVAMPECGIGFVPDVGGTLLLAGAPGRLGEYLGLTAARMGPGDAIHAGFADAYVPQDRWGDLVQALCDTGDTGRIDDMAEPAPASDMAAQRDRIDAMFGGDRLEDVRRSVETDDSAIAQEAAKAMARNAPLSMAVTLGMIREMRAPGNGIRDALRTEYRVAHRIIEDGDFLEGVRAAIIDKDRNPRWQHADGHVPDDAVVRMLAPLGADDWDFHGD
ncbi:enoyl-CoA hydratase/isomerase family protein [Citreimonas salinaria]|uniref:3-hydroxyisobutyryl-CoA hydrolase n=1 Tax=Citreimonas salinaria TaxID=321339 RepID=A0A1H3IIA8_9RHOB|nr:enoyl-CoA hydratase/isomerase family protein [Citreimonas salinaria]SDY27317.1 enoyl-CoA hydratase [Citreimonas salinaria]